MPFKTSSRITFLITWKKVITSKVNFFLLAGFLLFLFSIWIRDSYELSFTFFLYLFPHLFLLLSQGMVRDEVESGSLENAMFLEGRFKKYLVEKNAAVLILGSAVSLIVFTFFAVYGLSTHVFSALYFYKFLIGTLVGIYYVFLGVLLGYSFKGGSNVLILVLAQVMIFFGFSFTASNSPAFLDYIDKGSFPDLISKIKFMGLVVIFPNFVISEKFFIYSLEVGALCVLLFLLQKMRIRNVELIRE